MKYRLPRDLMITYKRDSALAWFDGATQKDGSLCGAGGVIKTLEALVFKWTFNCDRGTNTKDELLGAWAIVLLVNSLSISNIHVLGDLKVVIDWLLNKGSLQVSAVEGWKNRIKALSKYFLSINYQHIFRNFNVEEDKLSKMALEETEGILFYHQWINGVEGPRRQIRFK